jgi:nanoRNase/pAp phosphatase (c-di-AMP/oligoRNAs hydrolase)
MHTTAKQIHDHIQSAERIALVSHQNPDGDTLGFMPHCAIKKIVGF